MDPTRLATRSILYLSVCFFFLFSGYTVFRSLLPALRPSDGPLQVAGNYVAYALGSLFSPDAHQLQRWRRVCMALAAGTYPLWMAALALDSTWSAGMPTTVLSSAPWFDGVFAALSLLNGYAAGVLWSTQGSWAAETARIDPAHAGRFHGTFFALYGLSGFVGNVVVASVSASVSIPVLLWSLVAISLLGALCIATTPSSWMYLEESVPHVPSPAPAAASVSTPPSRRERLASMRSVRYASSSASPTTLSVARTSSDADGGGCGDDDGCLLRVRGCCARRFAQWRSLFGDTAFLLYVPSIVSLGAASAFAWVTLPRAAAIGNVHSVAVAFACYALAAFLASLLSGAAWFDWGRTETAALGGMLLLVLVPVYTVLAFANDSTVPLGQLYVLCLFAALLGIAVSVCTAAHYVAYGRDTSLNHSHRSPVVYAMHSALYCVSYAIVAGVSRALSLQGVALLGLACAVVAMLSMWALVMARQFTASLLQGGGV